MGVHVPDKALRKNATAMQMMCKFMAKGQILNEDLTVPRDFSCLRLCS